MGRQVGFYMIGEDLAEFEARLKAWDNDLVILVDPMQGPDLRTTDTLQPIPGDFGTRSLARREDLPLMRLRHVPTMNYDLLDRMFSPVVEFSQSFLDERVDRLRAGRLYVSTSYWDENDQLVRFPKEFLTWASQLMALIRKGKTFTLLKDPLHGGDYLSERARGWVEAGGKLFGTP